MGNKVSNIEDKRIIQIGKPNFGFPDNKITSSKYTLWNFLPKNLFKQFRRLANFYFLIMSIITCAIDSPVSPWASFSPLIIVVSVSAIKQAYEDWLRHKTDMITNTRLVTVLQDGIEKIKASKDIRVGDIIKIPNDCDVPCDLVILNTSKNDSKCYVTTSNLDGETNLKRLECPLHSYITRTGMEQINGNIKCEIPTADLYSFNGELDLVIDHEDMLVKMFPENIDSDIEPDMEDSFNVVTFKTPLTANNLLLRGSRLKNTDFAIGCAVYTGHDTKLAYNSRKTSQKAARSERAINYYLLFFFCLLVLEVIISLIMDFYEDLGDSRPYLGYYAGLKLENVLTEFFSYIVLYYYIIPISLYVTIEFQRFLGAWYFNWDIGMSYNDQQASANTSDINEDLGQIEYLFTDKTGTLTKNEMVFQQFSVNGVCYSESNGMINEVKKDELLPLTTWPKEVEMLLLGMSICHTVQCCSDVKTNINNLNMGYLPKYEATSADEKALVEASARCGVVYLGEESGIITVQVKNKLLTFKKFKQSEFTSDRKRMSVLVVQEDGTALQFCKGAESAVITLVSCGMIDEELQNAKMFSLKGLRTLVFAWRIVEDESLTNIKSISELSETGLTLLGVTAVEDELQLDVQKTLYKNKKAGIKIWILTGDRVETAITIAMACGHMKSDILQLKLVEHSEVSTCLENLKHLKSQIKEDFSLIVDGRSFKIAVDDPECAAIFLEVALKSNSVLCCRLAPKQKSQIVHLVKETIYQPTTAAIGDGANDVSMILEAHIGIGLLGKEGRQAANNADFVLPVFCALQRALFVHGHWYYHRICNLIQYFFIKISSLLLLRYFLHFIMECPLSHYSVAYFSFCTIRLFTSLPILFYSLLEQDHSSEILMNDVNLYTRLKNNSLLSWKTFFGWLICAVITQSLLDTSFLISIGLSIVGFLTFTILYSIVNIPLDPLYGVYTKIMASPSFWLVFILVTITSLLPDCLATVLFKTVFRQSGVYHIAGTKPHNKVQGVKII